MKMMYVVAFAVSMLALGHCQETISIENTTYVEVMATGKRLVASKQMNISTDMNKITVEIQSLTEIKIDGMEDRSEDFTNVTLTLGTVTDATGDVASKQLLITSGNTDVLGGKLTLTIDVFKADGNVTRDTENTKVMTGDVRISAKLESYTFPENITMLKLSFGVSGSATSAPKANDATTDGDSYTLGGGGVVKLSRKAMEGSSYVDVMPMLSNNMGTVTFNSTSETLIEYSLFLELATPKVQDISSSSRVTSLGIMLWFLVMAHRILWY